ncbi:hypothetical protein [Chromobacterium alkanivorans]|nr:hypothetical protein [Chromobacterium alkanivorans]
MKNKAMGILLLRHVNINTDLDRVLSFAIQAKRKILAKVLED